MTRKEIINDSMEIFVPLIAILCGLGILGYLLYNWPNLVVCAVITIVAIITAFDH